MSPLMAMLALLPASAVAIASPMLQQSRHIVSLQQPLHEDVSLLRLRGGGPSDYDLTTQTLADMAGTFVLLLAVRFSSKVPPGWTSPVQVPVLSTLGVLIWFFGPISGAYFNPAVNFASLVTGEMSFNKFLIFSFVQLAAAGVCAKLVQALVP